MRHEQTAHTPNKPMKTTYPHCDLLSHLKGWKKAWKDYSANLSDQYHSGDVYAYDDIDDGWLDHVQTKIYNLSRILGKTDDL